MTKFPIEIEVQVISTCSTKELVAELSKREGVSVENAEPYTDKQISVNGPAVILIVVD